MADLSVAFDVRDLVECLVRSGRQRTRLPPAWSVWVGWTIAVSEDPRRPLRFLGDPCACVPCSKTPAGSTHLAHGGVPLLPSENPISSAPTTGLLSEFDRTAHMLAVYASRTGSPQHPARLATRPVAGLCRGGIGYPLDLGTRFRGFRSSHPPCPDFPDAPGSPTGAASDEARGASPAVSARESRTRSVRSSRRSFRCS